MVIDRGFERKLLEVASESCTLHPEDEARLFWLQDKEVVIRHGDFERGFTSKEWSNYLEEVV